ncbi:MAG TPA: putative lipid II flippase FtsW [Spirochaetia bacterium]|nr:putative lipid II flippase FtsW [Spirochaetia bacterium]
MSERFALERTPQRRDAALMIVLVLLIGLGLSALFSASYNWAEQLYGDPFRLIRRQAIWVLLGSFVAFLAYTVPLKVIRSVVPAMVVGALGLMALTFVPGLGEEYLGGRRWILLFGASFQPSEFVKVVLVVYLAHMLDRKRDTLDDTMNSVLPPLIVVAVFGSLIYLQNDFSTSVFVVLVSLLMLFVARVRLRFFFGLGVVATPLAVILLLTREHRVLRILAFIDPNLDRFGSGYQVLAAQRALEQGGLWGRGIGQGLQKYGSLPEPHSDFVFAVLGEELGYLGVVVVLGLFIAFAVKGYGLAFAATSTFRSLLAFGLTSVIVLQALLNMAVVCGLVPATGIPLPFFSHGGSAILMTLVMCGLLLNVAREEFAARSEDVTDG